MTKGKITQSVCIYCGCGCKLGYEVKNNQIIKIHPVKNDDVSDGAPCIKGLTIHEVYDKNRITKPLIKGKETTIKQAIRYVKEHTKGLAPSELFFNTSGKITNENNYVLEKFARDYYKTPNIDSCCGRLCHNATVMGMNNVYGTPNRTWLKNVKKINTLLIIGSEPEKNYPIFYNKLLKKKKLKIIRVNAFTKALTKQEEAFIINPSSETCLLNGLINELIKKVEYCSLEGYEILKEVVNKYSPEMVCANTGLSLKKYQRLIKLIINSGKLGIFHGMGLTQHVNSIENVHSLLNLALLKKALILTLRGEINVQGAGDVSGSSCTGFKKCKGLNILEALILSPVKACFITEFNPLKSLPDTKQVRKKLNKMFITYFGAYNNDTSKMADVVIPIASLLECDGTITNGERRVRKVNKVFKSMPQLWEVLQEFTNKKDYKNSREIFNEIKKRVIDYSLINTKQLWAGIDAWPDKSVKHKRFMPEEFDGLSDVRSDNYPFILTTYRSKYSFLSNEATGESKTLKRVQEEPGFYFNPVDLKSLKIKEGTIIKVTSTVNSLRGRAYASNNLPQGVIGAYIHYSKLPINKLFPLKFDEESFTPNYKSVAVNVIKI